jgi:asparagine synthase (glutamine-hydrolysing)
MCGIAGAISLDGSPIPEIEARLSAMNSLQAHRGPDGHAIWVHPDKNVGLAHRRLSIIGLGETGTEPMRNGDDWLTFNGEIYNYLELKQQLGKDRFHTETDTETLLHGYSEWGTDVIDHLRGMFAFALWDERNRTLMAARDRFGIKPFHYTVVDRVLYFASEAKALMPFLPAIETDEDALRDYLAFQFVLEGKTLFRGVSELPPAHRLTVKNGAVEVERYWEVHYERDFDHTPQYFEERIDELLSESVDLHLRSDVEVGAYVSGGVDSSLIAAMAREKYDKSSFIGFTGRFAEGPEFDESAYARDVAVKHDFELLECEIGVDDFIENLPAVIYHLDQPMAGPGSFPQFMVSRLAAESRKVVLGGQGGDEVFGGYARYLIAYFEQCIKGAIDGTLDSGKFIVSYESIIPNLQTLKQYQPLLQKFWSNGLFGPMDERYFQLIHRATDTTELVRLDRSSYDPLETFKSIFNADNVSNGSYFDSMTHFDFKTLLPALLHVEDRMSMAHGLEARVPLLDHPLVEFAATIPADVKFKDGTLKRVLRDSMGHWLPQSIVGRKDKMGFPVPLSAWLKGPARDFAMDVLSTGVTRQRAHIDNGAILKSFDAEAPFGRGMWGFLSLELWQQQFHDRHAWFQTQARETPISPVLA